MPQYVIERDMPGVGNLSDGELKGASQTSCTVLRDLGPEIQWVHSAQQAGFPANKISEVRATIDPTTAE